MMPLISTFAGVLLVGMGVFLGLFWGYLWGHSTASKSYRQKIEHLEYLINYFEKGDKK